jgi:hypothetical protein
MRSKRRCNANILVLNPASKSEFAKSAPAYDVLDVEFVRLPYFLTRPAPAVPAPAAVPALAEPSKEWAHAGFKAQLDTDVPPPSTRKAEIRRRQLLREAGGRDSFGETPVAVESHVWVIFRRIW